MKRNQPKSITALPTPEPHPMERLVGFLHLFVLLGLTVTFLMTGMSYARAHEHARAHNDTQQAALPVTMPEAPLTIAAVCDRGVAVFSVQNNVGRWQARGAIRVVAVTNGQVLRERTLTLGERQMATFRVPHSALLGGSTRVTVHLPGDTMAYVKSFSGGCSSPQSSIAVAER